jgi:uncharacterized membrane protein
VSSRTNRDAAEIPSANQNFRKIRPRRCQSEHLSHLPKLLREYSVAVLAGPLIVLLVSFFSGTFFVPLFSFLSLIFLIMALGWLWPFLSWHAAWVKYKTLRDLLRTIENQDQAKNPKRSLPEK